jgi:hypothetical protein
MVSRAAVARSPKPSKCKCHDHDGQPKPTTLKRCGSGEVKLVAPALTVAVPAIEPVIVDEPRLSAVSSDDPIAVPEDITYEIETPPF